MFMLAFGLTPAARAETIRVFNVDFNAAGGLFKNSFDSTEMYWAHGRPFNNDGTIELEFAEGYNPTAGDSWTLIELTPGNTLTLGDMSLWDSGYRADVVDNALVITRRTLGTIFRFQ